MNNLMITFAAIAVLAIAFGTTASITSAKPCGDVGCCVGPPDC